MLHVLAFNLGRYCALQMLACKWIVILKTLESKNPLNLGDTMEQKFFMAQSIRFWTVLVVQLNCVLYRIKIVTRHGDKMGLKFNGSKRRNNDKWLRK